MSLREEATYVDEALMELVARCKQIDRDFIGYIYEYEDDEKFLKSLCETWKYDVKQLLRKAEQLRSELNCFAKAVERRFE